MKVSVTHARAVQGNDIDVKVDADGTETISTVGVTLDGFAIANNVLDPAGITFERSFAGAGDAGPGMDHELHVVAGDEHGKTSSAVYCWTDPI
jgi:hypothetical protein